ALGHKARQRGARELLLGRGLPTTRSRRQRRRRVKRQHDTDRDDPHDSASLAVSPLTGSPPHCEPMAQYPIRLSICCNSPPPASMLRILAAISVTSCATVGRRATCGITVTFGCAQSGLSGGNGSCHSASSAAYDNCPESSAAIKSFSTTCLPRPTLMTIAPFGII